MTALEFIACHMAGPFTSVGCYSVYFIMADGQTLSWQAVDENYNLILETIRRGDKENVWFPIGHDVNWEDVNLMCAHLNIPIECAYHPDDRAEYYDTYDPDEEFRIAHMD